LAWYLLKEDIQHETHDSIEDARTALRLWRKYEEFCDAGVIDQMLEEIYREGRKWGYKPPSEQGSGSAGAEAAKAGAMTQSLEAPTGLSAPPTPAGKRGIPRESEYFESPLR
jgi:PAB-dependent poly(A)-specific ribonuclease subunit 2